uniref:IS66 family transposase n=1 Tax=Enterococcus faecium TaxID=1352 RepID=UPI002922EF0C|nr:hypothetical protein BCMPIHFP_00074 [Enterococcus faecium]
MNTHKEKTFYWLYASGKSEEKQVVLYEHANSRSVDEPKSFLESFSGFLHTDGYTEFFHWCESFAYLPKSQLGKAVQYAVNHKDGLQIVLLDGRLELSNNRAERAIKELVIGRKNWLFSKSLKGARSNGIILSIIQTAVANGLNIRKYLNHLFTEIPNIKGEKC